MVVEGGKKTRARKRKAGPRYRRPRDKGRAKVGPAATNNLRITKTKRFSLHFIHFALRKQRETGPEDASTTTSPQTNRKPHTDSGQMWLQTDASGAATAGLKRRSLTALLSCRTRLRLRCGCRRRSQELAGQYSLCRPGSCKSGTCRFDFVVRLT